MDKLTKLAILVCIIGIILLFTITQIFDFTFQNINNMTQKNKGRDITIKGKLQKIQKRNNTLILKIKTTCYMDAIYYDKDFKIDENKFEGLTNKNITLKGTVENYFNPSIFANQIQIS
jgi:hypothetical protein